MPKEVQLVGIDVGSTTCSAIVATAHLVENSVGRRRELTGVRECFRSEMVFTPYTESGIDEQTLGIYLRNWLGDAGVQPDQVFGGGALLTGLAAQQANARRVVQLVREVAGDALVATADDPGLESWLAFLGSCDALSRANPQTPILNLDIGGGTTNLALGKAGQVLRTGCLSIGARHIQVEPGVYRITSLTPQARATFAHLGIARDVGQQLTPGEVDAVLEFYVRIIEYELQPDARQADVDIRRDYEQVPFHLPHGFDSYAVTVSGGVGELVYAHLHGEPWPSTTKFGDLGIDLARRLVEASPWAGQLNSKTFLPAGGGRATVLGLLRHATEVSGSTIYLPHPECLPVAEVPLVGSISPETSDEELGFLLEFVGHSPRGGGLFVALGSNPGTSVRDLGRRLADACRTIAFPPERPLVLLLSENLGKTLGHYITEWGAAPLNLIVIDEITARDAQFVHIGRPREQVVPVSFFGLREASAAS
jgi:ethanolamine utilization protein EutA